jgi:flagellum-specific peptidoglycan hydrolase FlgJ
MQRPFYKLGQLVAAAAPPATAPAVPATPVDVGRTAAQASNVAPDWKTYAGNAQRYLDRPVFSGTPLTGQMLSTAASNTFARTGIQVPLKLALAQAQFESGMGRKGRSPARNPYNVGEYDTKTVQSFPSTKAGVQAYYDLIARRYLPKGRQLDDLLKNFAWASNPKLRYASNPQYEQKLRDQIKYIGKYLGK